MIHGINFNSVPLPSIARPFAQRVKMHANGTFYAVGWDKACDFFLAGMCNTDAEAHRMITQATNGHRKIHLVKRDGWIAIYCG